MSIRNPRTNDDFTEIAAHLLVAMVGLAILAEIASLVFSGTLI